MLAYSLVVTGMTVLKPDRKTPLFLRRVPVEVFKNEVTQIIHSLFLSGSAKTIHIKKQMW